MLLLLACAVGLAAAQFPLVEQGNTQAVGYNKAPGQIVATATILMIPSEDNSTCYLTHTHRMHHEALVIDKRRANPVDVAHMSADIAQACFHKPTFWLVEPPKGSTIMRSNGGRVKRQTCSSCCCVAAVCSSCQCGCGVTYTYSYPTYYWGWGRK